MPQLTQKSYSFYSDNLNIGKYDILYNKALQLRDFKNNISTEVCNNPIHFFNLSKFDWINHFRCKLNSCNNQDISNAISDTYVAYENKISSFNKKSKSKIQKEIKYAYYKVNTKNNKKGDLKDKEIVFKETKLTKVVSYLVKYYHDKLIDYLKENNNTELRNDVLYYIDKYENRLLNLVKNKQNNIINSLTKHSITFTSLSFTSCTEQKINIINKNKNQESLYNCFISLSGQKTDDGKIHIPIKYSRNYHGNLKYYYKKPNKKGQRVISYKICFEGNKIRVILSKPKFINEVKYKTDYYGIDINVKHNLFVDKYGNIIDYDRDLFNDYVKFLKELDDKKTRKEKNSKLSIKDTIKLTKFKIKITDMLKRKSSVLVKQTKDKGFNHLILEDLGVFGKSFTKSDEYEGFKYSRLVKLLNLSSIKNIVKSIGDKNNIQVTFVQPYYTSQTCECCGSVTRDNRKVQEEFECISCGHKSNADTHSAKMIEDRMVLDVLRKSLMIKEKGLYRPKKLSKSKIKSHIVECYDIKQDKVFA
jgi:putative transposase